jgi:deoxyribonuclease V
VSVAGVRDFGVARFGAVDVHYPQAGGAVSALVIAADAAFSEITEAVVREVAVVADYEPGALYKRELPPVRAVLDATSPVGLVVVDGYVTLDPVGRPGLGAHVREIYGVPVIGVAKTAFRGASHAVEVRRGRAVRPLYVTSAGVRPEEAAELVRGMAGEHRIPDALRLVDRLSRRTQNWTGAR